MNYSRGLHQWKWFKFGLKLIQKWSTHHSLPVVRTCSSSGLAQPHHHLKSKNKAKPKKEARLQNDPIIVARKKKEFPSTGLVPFFRFVFVDGLLWLWSLAGLGWAGLAGGRFPGSISLPLPSPPPSTSLPSILLLFNSDLSLPVSFLPSPSHFSHLFQRFFSPSLPQSVSPSLPSLFITNTFTMADDVSPYPSAYYSHCACPVPFASRPFFGTRRTFTTPHCDSCPTVQLCRRKKNTHTRESERAPQPSALTQIRPNNTSTHPTSTPFLVHQMTLSLIIQSSC